MSLTAEDGADLASAHEDAECLGRECLGPEWQRFRDALALSLAQLDTDQAVIVEARRKSRRYVRFVHYGPAGLRADTANDLTPGAGGEVLAAHGWVPPGPEASDPDTAPADPDEVDTDPRNWHREWPQPVPYEEAADLAVATLRSVLEVPVPALLSYNAFHQCGAPIILPNLGIVRSRPVANVTSGEPTPQTRETLLETVRQVLAERIGVAEVPVDPDGDIPITTEAAQLFVRIRREALVVTVFSPLVWGFGNPPDILETINTFNRDMLFARAVWNGQGVVLVADTLGDPFDADVFWNNVMAVVSLAGTYARTLQERYGGSTSFGESVAPAAQKPAARQFGYL